MKVAVGVSGCLLGLEIRFDGGHKHDPFLTRELEPFVDWVPVCPELAAGLGVPREAIRQVRDGARVRLIGSRTGNDVTSILQAAAAREVARIAALPLCGFVLESRSPSCGLERVRVYDRDGVPHPVGTGVFARALRERLPLLPVEERGRLCDPVLRESWLEAVFAYARWRALRRAPVQRRALIELHAAHKYLLLAHDPSGYAELGRLVAAPGAFASDEAWADAYGDRFMAAMNRRATVGRHVNVMHHIVGYFRGALHAAHRDDLLAAIDDYQAGRVPLGVPIALLHHTALRLELRYLLDQTYLRPTPRELATRAHLPR